jgi:hypothetical protein
MKTGSTGTGTERIYLGEGFEEKNDEKLLVITGRAYIWQ